jgi:hypothetical protein
MPHLRARAVAAILVSRLSHEQRSLRVRAYALISVRPAHARQRGRIPRAGTPCWRWRHPPSLDDPTIPYDVIRREHSPPAGRGVR